jgi:UDP-glucose 4-epimerase
MTPKRIGRRWLITGGCGFIGSNLIQRLLKDGTASSIRVLDDLSVGRITSIENFSPVEILRAPREMSDRAVIELVQTSITGNVSDWVEGAEVVVHLAANTGVQPSIESPRLDMEKNVVGTLNMLEAARRANVESFIFASSGAPTGNVEPPIHEEVPCHPMSPYGASKLAGEGYCSAYFWSYGLRTVALRFSNVYGPRSTHKGSLVALFLRQAYLGQPWTINGDGAQTRDFIYVDDLVRAIVASASFEGGGEIFQIATGRETSVREIADLLADGLSRNVGVRAQYQSGPPLKGDMKRNFASISKAQRLLGWEPTVSLDEGIAQTIRWYDQQNTASSRL